MTKEQMLKYQKEQHEIDPFNQGPSYGSIPVDWDEVVRERSAWRASRYLEMYTPSDDAEGNDYD